MVGATHFFEKGRVMIVDNQLFFSNAQAVTTTAASSNVSAYDATGNPLNGTNIGQNSTFGSDLGAGDGLRPKIACYVGTAFAGGTSLAVAFQGSTDNSTWTTYATTPAIVTADLTAGTRLAAFDWPVVPQNESLPRYYRLYYTVVGTMTAGTINAGIVMQQDVTENSRLRAAAYAVGS